MENTSTTKMFIFKPSICLSNGKEVFKVYGNFVTTRLDVNKPVVKIMRDLNNTLLKWVFHKNFVSTFTLNSISNGVSSDQIVTNLTNPSLTNFLDFNLTIACQGSNLEVTFNDHWLASLGFNSSELNFSNEIVLSGGLKVVKAGYTGQVIY